MYEIKIAFNRQAGVIETGTCVVEVKDPNDMREINKKLYNKDFKELLITDRDYDEEDWDFELLNDEEEDLVG